MSVAWYAPLTCWGLKDWMTFSAALLQPSFSEKNSLTMDCRPVERVQVSFFEVSFFLPGSSPYLNRMELASRWILTLPRIRSREFPQTAWFLTLPRIHSREFSQTPLNLALPRIHSREFPQTAWILTLQRIHSREFPQTAWILTLPRIHRRESTVRNPHPRIHSQEPAAKTPPSKIPASTPIFKIKEPGLCLYTLGKGRRAAMQKWGHAVVSSEAMPPWAVKPCSSEAVKPCRHTAVR